MPIAIMIGRTSTGVTNMIGAFVANTKSANSGYAVNERLAGGANTMPITAMRSAIMNMIGAPTGNMARRKVGMATMYLPDGPRRQHTRNTTIDSQRRFRQVAI